MDDEIQFFSARYRVELPEGFFDSLEKCLLERIPSYSGPIACGKERRKEFIFNREYLEKAREAFTDACAQYAMRVRFDKRGAVISRKRIPEN